MSTGIRTFRRSAAQSEALDRVREWVRARFALADATVFVAEVACGLPGCPPVETVIAFWFDGRRHHYKVFKPVAEVVADDLPPRWMRSALAVSDDDECGCC